MDHLGSFQHSEVPAASPYWEPSQSRPCFPFNLMKINLKFNHSYNSGTYKLSLSLRISYQIPEFLSPLPHTWFMKRPNHSSWLENRKIFGAVNRSLSFSQFSFPNPCYPSTLSLKYSPQHPINTHPQPTFLPQRKQNISHTHKTIHNNIFLYVFIILVL